MLQLSTIRSLRRQPGRSALLFLTDRCPVECAHCSVDSRPESPMITDWALFERLIDGLCRRAPLALVGISGGEPFVERRGLDMATARLAGAGKRTVLYTSGIWARRRVPAWSRRILGRVDTVFLSTDAYHQAQMDDARFLRAIAAVVASGAWLVLATIHEPREIEAAHRLLTAALGDDWGEHAELSLNPTLGYGRAAGLVALSPLRTGSAFGACSLAASPVVRYDGVVTGCCNERVIMGQGLDRLRFSAAGDVGLGAILDRIRRDPLHSIIGRVGIRAAVEHPRFARFSQQQFRSICDACWALNEHQRSSSEASDPLLQAMGILAAAPDSPG